MPNKEKYDVIPLLHPKRGDTHMIGGTVGICYTRRMHKFERSNEPAMTCFKGVDRNDIIDNS